ncbi:hypothetical protein CLV70_12538 [Pseudosporangium ferrugineum]|uniref:Lipoprotein n=2 Tax=Pseudosporangium ferrugineum TaxID=439699 RepID=A0A2T0RG81_9ACTN|nr:hypothetical protein CLV70_12538 [Pseudosporangium ferrugineum]
MVAAAVLMPALVFGFAGCAASPERADEDVAGPQWQLIPRRAPGAADATHPARLTGVRAEDQDGFDRLTFTYAGERPGYLVAYAGSDADGRTTLRVILEHVTGRTSRDLTPDLQAIRGVRQRPADDQTIETTVRVTDAGRGKGVPFRVGLSIGGFYVDVAHPDQLTVPVG